MPRVTFFLSILGTFGCAQSAVVPSESPIDGPFVQENLAVFVVRGPSTDTREYITLDEGLASGQVAVREQGAAEGQDRAQVNTLEVENKSDNWLFLQAGDVIQGGKQDRTIRVDAALPPHSKPTPIGAFCVERGRWAGKTASFSDNNAILGDNSLKLAVQRDMEQGKVWEEVRKQEALAKKKIGGGGGGGSLSRTGTYSALVDNEKIKADREAYVRSLLPRFQGADALGLVVAVNGEILASDVYGSGSLFHKISRKLLDSYAMVAVLSRDPNKKDFAAPTQKAALQFLAESRQVEAKDETFAESSHRRTRETESQVQYEYRALKADLPMHVNTLKK